ncbi:MAG: hypothetical protein ACTSRA_10735, partial [Promethearchaeota archaeon]
MKRFDDDHDFENQIDEDGYFDRKGYEEDYDELELYEEKLLEIDEEIADSTQEDSDYTPDEENHDDDAESDHDDKKWDHNNVDEIQIEKTVFQEEEVSTREIVVPGQILGKRGPDLISGFGTITDNKNNIISLYVGFIQKKGRYVNVIPFKSRYIPHVGDKVIGKIIDKNVVLYKVDIASPYVAILRPIDTNEDSSTERNSYKIRRSRQTRHRGSRMKEDTSLYEIGDIIIAKVIKFDRTTEPTLTTIGSPDLGRIKGGFITKISVPKIPRMIRKNGSMIR